MPYPAGSNRRSGILFLKVYGKMGNCRQTGGFSENSTDLSHRSGDGTADPQPGCAGYGRDGDITPWGSVAAAVSLEDERYGKSCGYSGRKNQAVQEDPRHRRL